MNLTARMRSPRPGLARESRKLGNQFSILLYLIAAAVPAAAAEGKLSLAERQSLQLLEVRTIFVDPFNDDSGGRQVRDMIIGSLQRLGLFVITEDEERADAFLRGSAEDLLYTDYYRSRQGLNVRGSTSSSQRQSGESDFGAASFGIGETEDSSRRERKHDASAAVRLVLLDGQVIWSTTQESLGAKYKGSAADVADRVASELLNAVKRARKLAAGRLAKPAAAEPLSRR